MESTSPSPLIIRVRLFATLARERGWRHGEARALVVPPGAGLTGVIGALGLAPALVRYVFLNGHRCPPDYQPAADDELAIFPPIAGG